MPQLFKRWFFTSDMFCLDLWEIYLDFGDLNKFTVHVLQVFDFQWLLDSHENIMVYVIDES